MIDRTEAEDHLRVIRSLMEKATIYRAISAEAAAVGGVLAILASFAFGPWYSFVVPVPVPEISGAMFVGLWLTVLVITAVANVVFLWRAAVRRGEKLVSAGMRLAVRALLPSYFVAGCLTTLGFGVLPNLVVPVWILSHGLALTSTGHFAPPSLRWLGWAFIMAGLASVLPVVSSNYGLLGTGGTQPEDLPRLSRCFAILTGQQWMAYTFGFLHLLYAACTWPRGSR